MANDIGLGGIGHKLLKRVERMIADALKTYKKFQFHQVEGSITLNQMPAGTVRLDPDNPAGGSIIVPPHEHPYQGPALHDEEDDRGYLLEPGIGMVQPARIEGITMFMDVDVAWLQANSASRVYVLLTDSDGAYLTDSDGAYLIEGI